MKVSFLTVFLSFQYFRSNVALCVAAAVTGVRTAEEIEKESEREGREGVERESG